LAVVQKGPLPQAVVQALDKGWQIAKAQTPDYWHLDLTYTYNTVQELFGKELTGDVS
jgi:aflatoxin B1 aldehyde reductase